MFHVHINLEKLEVLVNESVNKYELIFAIWQTWNSGLTYL